MKTYKRLDALESNQYKPALLDWLQGFVSPNNYNHSFRDKFMTFHVDENCILSISFDFRCMDQVILFRALPREFKGTIQKETGNLVNSQTVYIHLAKHFACPEPEIVKSKIISTYDQKDNDGNLYYIYKHKSLLSDGTYIFWTNQDKTKSISDYTLKTTIFERCLISFLEHYYI